MARDIDVLLSEVRNDAARSQLRVARDEAYATAKSALGSARLRTLVLDLVEWLTIGIWLSAPADRTLIDRSLDSFAAEVLDRCRRHVKRRGRHWSRLDNKGLHKLRIKVKKLRYSAEFFGSLFPGNKANRRRRAFLEVLEALQTYLGDLNDQTTGIALLAKFGITDTATNKATGKSLCHGAKQAYDALIDAKRFWR